MNAVRLVFHTQWCVMVAKELLASSTFRNDVPRLWCLPEKLVEAMEKFGLLEVCGGDALQEERLRSLIEVMRNVKWELVDPYRVRRAMRNDLAAPVFDCGYHVPRDDQRWCIKDPSCMRGLARLMTIEDRLRGFLRE